MHLCFVDESGTPPSKPNPSHLYFTLGAVIIDDQHWREIANTIIGFLTSNRLRGELKWRYFAPRNADPDNPLIDRTSEERKRLSLDLAAIIAKSPLTVIACVTDIDAAFRYASITSQQELYHFAYKPISERFQYFLQENKSRGIMIADHRGRDSDRLFRAHHDNLTGGTANMVSTYDRFIEGLFLQDSRHSIGIQLADFVAGAIHRAYATGDNQIASLIKPRLRRRPDGNYLGHGIVHHPKDRFKLKATTVDGQKTPGGAVAPTP